MEYDIYDAHWVYINIVGLLAYKHMILLLSLYNIDTFIYYLIDAALYFICDKLN